MKLIASIKPKMHVKTGILAFGLILISVAAACSTNVATSTKARDDSFTVAESRKIVVNGSNGRINVGAGTDDTVRVQATLRRPDNLKYEVTQDGNPINVEVEEQGGRFSFLGQSPGADIEITVPSNTRVGLRTGDGTIELYGMHQSGTVRSSNGKIIMDDVTGDFDVHASNGSVDIAGATVTFDIESSNERIVFAGVIVPSVGNRMTTTNGSAEITLHRIPGEELDASTTNGSIKTRLPILTTFSGDKHHIVGTIGAGDAELFVKTANGPVTVQRDTLMKS